MRNVVAPMPHCRRGPDEVGNIARHLQAALPCPLPDGTDPLRFYRAVQLDSAVAALGVPVNGFQRLFKAVCHNAQPGAVLDAAFNEAGTVDARPVSPALTLLF